MTHISRPNLRVASYNIRKCIGLDRRRDPERTVAVLNEIDADIITLQEADRRVGARASAIPPELLHRDSRYRAVELGGRSDSIVVIGVVGTAGERTIESAAASDAVVRRSVAHR